MGSIDKRDKGDKGDKEPENAGENENDTPTAVERQILWIKKGSDQHAVAWDVSSKR